MVGVSLKMWEEEGEEEFCLVLAGLPALGPLLLLLDTMGSEVGHPHLSSLVPPALLATSPNTKSTWSAANTLRKTQQSLRERRREEVDFVTGLVKEVEEEVDNVVGCVEEKEEVEEEVADLDFVTDLMQAKSEKDWGDRSYDAKEAVARRPKCEFECNVCDEVFYVLKDLKHHQSKDHEDLFCSKCGIASPTVELVPEHNCSKPHACLVCRRLFSTNHELKAHSLIHSGEKPHQCDDCGKGFRQRSTLDRHKLTHETKRNFDCDVCGKKFKFKHYLVSHKLLHSGDKPHMCTWCGMTFTQNANMQKHVRMKHTNNKGHVCSYCGKSFVQAYYLRRHLATHREAGLEKATLAALVETHTSSDEQVGIRTLACRLCSVTCKGEAELVDHMGRKHVGSHLKMESKEGMERQAIRTDSKEDMLVEGKGDLVIEGKENLAMEEKEEMELDSILVTEGPVPS